MSSTRLAVSLLFLLACASASQAQLSMPLYTTTYCVQVKYEMWRNGTTYWATEFETSNLNDAELVYDLFEASMDDGSICDILGCGFDWIAVDVRIRTKYEWNIYPSEYWQSPSALNRRVALP